MITAWTEISPLESFNPSKAVSKAEAVASASTTFPKTDSVITNAPFSLRIDAS